LHKGESSPSVDLKGVVVARMINVMADGGDEEDQYVNGGKIVLQANVPDNAIGHLRDHEAVLEVVKRYAVVT